VDSDVASSAERETVVIQLLGDGEKSSLILGHPMRFDASREVVQTAADDHDSEQTDDVEPHQGEHDDDCASVSATITIVHRFRWDRARTCEDQVMRVSIAAAATVLASTMVTVVALCIALVALGIVLLAIGVQLVRATRTDPAALGALEEMSDRRWRRGDAELRAEVLAGTKSADPTETTDDETSDVVATLPQESSAPGPAASELEPSEPVLSETTSSEPDLSEPGPSEPQPPTPPEPPAPEPPAPPAPEPLPAPEPQPPLPTPEPPPAPPEPMPPVPGPPPEPVPEPIPHPPTPDPIPSPFPPQPNPPPPIPQVESAAGEETDSDAPSAPPVARNA
jgi:hypothetical protein